MRRHRPSLPLVTYALLLFCHSSSAIDLYVSKQGSDTNTGTLSEPFLSLDAAAAIAQAGDTVHIREGVYEETLRPAHSGSSGSPIIFQSYQDEKVIITAMEALSNFDQHEGLIYSTTVDWDLGQLNFVMQNTTAMDLARWPNNIDGDPFTQNTVRNTGGSDADEIQNAHIDYSTGIPAGDWTNGGSVYFYGDRPGSGWTTWRAFITDQSTTSVSFVLDKNPSWIRTAHPPEDFGDFFLQGIYEALDYENEWYFNSQNNTLFVQLPSGGAPADGQIKMRRRVNTIDLNARNYIEIKNLAVFGGGIDITNNASNNLIYGVTSLYGNYTLGVVSGFDANSRSIYIHGGTDNRIEKSEIGFGAGSGIWDSGTRTHIINSYIHDFNYLGDYDAILMSRNGSESTVTQNTITRGGRDAIQSFNRNSEFSYNDISYSNLIVDDCALFYTVGGPHNTEVHHNWFHDAYSSGDKNKAAGIYLDNDAEAFSVHHNVVWNTEWSSVQINWNGTDLDIFNNTLWDGSQVMGAWHKSGTEFSNVRVWNNLANDNNWEPQSDKQNNVFTITDPFVDSATFDFRLDENSVAIDAGRLISGITDDISDNTPDAGAYERNGNNTNWVAGIDWDRKLGPTGRGCYNLPGEDCENPVTEVPSVSLSSIRNRIAEGQTIEILFSLSDRAMAYPVVIPYEISGSASNTDHNAQTGTLNITEGTSGSLNISLLSDTLIEGDETLTLSLLTPTNAVLGQSNNLSITIDDATPVPTPSATPRPSPTPTSGDSAGGGTLSPYAGLMLILFSLALRSRRKT